MPQLNTITWTAWMLAAALVCTLTYNPLYLALTLATLLLLSKTQKLDSSGYIKAGVLFSIPLLLVNTLFIHTGEHVLFTIPPKIGGMPMLLVSGPITLESIYAAFVFMLLMIDMLLLFMIYQSKTTPEAVLGFMPKSLTHSALLTATAMRFLPTLSTDFESIGEANRSRGMQLKGASFTQKIRNHSSLIVPALVNSLERSYNLAESMESRGYGGKRTRYKSEAWTKKDKTLVMVYAAVILLTLTLKFTGQLASANLAQTQSLLEITANPLVLASILSFTLPGVKK